MATKKQKQELIDVLKFTPIRVTLRLQGYGGEAYAGKVDRNIYEYFKENKIDIGEYASSWDGFEDIPESMTPFNAGSPYDCDNLFHASGAELSELNQIIIEDENSNTIWENNLSYSNLDELGVVVGEGGGGELLDLCDENDVVFWGGQGEKGCFFDAEFILRAPFDPKKLKITYENCDDWYIITGVEYDGEELDGFGGYSTTGKWTEHKWVLCNGEEVYDSVTLDDREDDEDFDPAKELDKIWEDAKTEWFDKNVRPTIKGEYEICLDAPWPLGGPGMAEWTGRSWKQDGKKIKITQWRGLKFDPNEV